MQRPHLKCCIIVFMFFFPENQNPHLSSFSLGLQMMNLFQNCVFLSHWISVATAVLHSFSLNHVIKLNFQLTA